LRDPRKDRGLHGFSNLTFLNVQVVAFGEQFHIHWRLSRSGQLLSLSQVLGVWIKGKGFGKANQLCFP
jgi:hypothetical protein